MLNVDLKFTQLDKIPTRRMRQQFSPSPQFALFVNFQTFTQACKRHAAAILDSPLTTRQTCRLEFTKQKTLQVLCQLDFRWSQS